MIMSSYYFWAPHEHEQLLLSSNAWAWAVITYELRMTMGNYYWWVAHDNENLLLLSNAWA